MKIVLADLESLAPYSQSRQYERDVPRNQGETPIDYDARTWRHRCHRDKNGFVIIPPAPFVRCIQDAAKYLSMTIPGKGKQTYTKNFKAGLLITEPITLPIKADQVEGEWLSLSPRGIRGGTGVWKCMPIIREWNGSVLIHILDETITPDVLDAHLNAAGSFIGIGRYRPINGGFYGRFRATKLEWN